MEEKEVLSVQEIEAQTLIELLDWPQTDLVTLLSAPLGDPVLLQALTNRLERKEVLRSFTFDLYNDGGGKIMVDLRVATLTGPETTLPEAVVEEFKKSLRGELLRPGSETYDLVRQIHNGMIDRHPALIARCAGVADVINAINFARATIFWYRCVVVAMVFPDLRYATVAS